MQGKAQPLARPAAPQAACAQRISYAYAIYRMSQN